MYFGVISSRSRGGNAGDSQKASFNNGSWQASNNYTTLDESASNGPNSRVSFGMKGINDGL